VRRKLGSAWVVTAVMVLVVVTLASGALGRIWARMDSTQLQPRVGGSYLMELDVQGKKASMMCFIGDSGEGMATRPATFGASNTVACGNKEIEIGESQATGVGIWKRNGFAGVDFTFLAFLGENHGTMRVRGHQTMIPRNGRFLMEIFPPGKNPLADSADCAIGGSFTFNRIPVMPVPEAQSRE
jgi:hypothetical protein